MILKGYIARELANFIYFIILAEISNISMEFYEILWFCRFRAFLCDSGGPGPLENVDIPIGILMFSAWDRQDTPKPSKY